MQRILLAFLIAAVAGCQSIAHRTSIAPDEANHRFVVKHSQPRQQAFSHVELALAEAYNDLPRVLKLKQAETGTYLLKPLVEYQVGGVIGPIQHARYTLKIIVGENSIPLEFQIEPGIETGYWPPPAEIPKIKASFAAIAEKIAKAVGGKLE